MANSEEFANVTQRGIYMLADTPLTAHPLALEDGSGDKNLLLETLDEHLTHEEIDELVSGLVAISNERASGTSIVCNACGHVRNTTEEYPTLVTCEACGSPEVSYAEQ